MATQRRKKTQSGQEIIEFGLVAILFVPLLLGTFVVGMNLIRSIQANSVCRDLTDMYIHGADFSSYSMQQEAQRLAQGLNLQMPSFSGNQATNTSTSGRGLVTVTQIMYVGPTTASNCAAVPAGSCTNHDSFVYTQQIQFGNSSLSNSGTVTLGTPSGATLATDGTVQNPVTDSHAKLGSAAQSAMAGLWQTTNNGQQPLTDGQVVYIVETYFQSPDLNVGSLAGSGVYARYFY
ncbi:MAG: pilus assembly protein [Acidobacteriia bacterium]|nr:pilus assembly protein [Terriglobia bacterium]